MRQDTILLSHGSGARLMHQLLEELIFSRFQNPFLKERPDAALLPSCGPTAFTTDSFVVSPLEFAGGDIGKLAVCGTVNDLVMRGARPQYLSLSLIVEEGLEISLLERILDSIAAASRKAGVLIVTGDFKVVERGACDKLFINTAGIGRIVARTIPSLSMIQAGDQILLTGPIGQHGLAVMSQRKGIDWGFSIKSDCAALNGLLVPVFSSTTGIAFMRDPTRGGLATVLNEIAQGSGFGVRIEESRIPVSGQVRAASELLGIEPLYAANEGCALLVVKPRATARILRVLRRHPLGRKSCGIGQIVRRPQKEVVLVTTVGTERILKMRASDPLPRIC